MSKVLHSWSQGPHWCGLTLVAVLSHDVNTGCNRVVPGCVCRLVRGGSSLLTCGAGRDPLCHAEGPGMLYRVFARAILAGAADGDKIPVLCKRSAFSQRLFFG